jgi:hypothetical protein
MSFDDYLNPPNKIEVIFTALIGLIVTLIVDFGYSLLWVKWVILPTFLSVFHLVLPYWGVVGLYMIVVSLIHMAVPSKLK